MEANGMKIKYLALTAIILLFLSSCELFEKHMYLSVPSIIAENDPNIYKGVVMVKTAPTHDIVVTLDMSSQGIGRLILPGAVTINEGVTFGTFNISVIHAGGTDAMVTITASNPIYTESSEVLTVKGVGGSAPTPTLLPTFTPTAAATPTPTNTPTPTIIKVGG
jgi:hypothetical protein